MNTLLIVGGILLLFTIVYIMLLHVAIINKKTSIDTYHQKLKGDVWRELIVIRDDLKNALLYIDKSNKDTVSWLKMELQKLDDKIKSVNLTAMALSQNLSALKTRLYEADKRRLLKKAKYQKGQHVKFHFDESSPIRHGSITRSDIVYATADMLDPELVYEVQDIDGGNCRLKENQIISILHD